MLSSDLTCQGGGRFTDYCSTLFIVADKAHCMPQWSVFTTIWVKLLEQQKFSYNQLGNSAIKGGAVHKNLHKRKVNNGPKVVWT